MASGLHPPDLKTFSVNICFTNKPKIPNQNLTLHIELVGDPEVTLQGRVADNAGQRVALGVTCGLPEVAHLGAGRAVDLIE